MYRNFFGLKESPFNVNPDPRFLFLTRHTEEALAGLTYGVLRRKGFILLTGEVGTGKTTLLNKLLDHLNRQRVSTAFIFNSRLNVTQFFDFLLSDFGIPCEDIAPRTMKSQGLRRLNQWLLERYQAGETAVLIVDEAQNLSSQVLEEIRLLTNLETSTDKLLQIVLSGQPELEHKLSRPELRQLRQRITLRCKTHPLTAEEVRGYILRRLQLAMRSNGSAGVTASAAAVFSNEAIARVHHHSRGIPRVINLLCEHALISAYAQQRKPIPPEIVDEVAREFQLEETEPLYSKTLNASPGAVNADDAPLLEVLQNLSALVGRLRKPE
jgi:general secretion pathway protein A